MEWGKDDFQRSQVIHHSFLSAKVSPEKALTPQTTKLPITEENKTFAYYQNLVFNLKATLSKIGLSSYTLLFYLKQSLTFTNNYLVYPLFQFGPMELFLKLTLSLSLVMGALYFGSYSFLFYLLAYLPISGLFYIPYFKYSQVADHWNYLGLVGILLFLSQGMKKFSETLSAKKDFIQFFLMVFVILFMTIKTFQYSSSFSNREENFKTNLAANPNSKILQEYLMHLFLEKESNNEAQFLGLMEKIYANSEREKENLFFTPNEAPQVLKAKIYYRAGLIPEAIKELDGFLRQNPQHNEAQILWAILIKLHRGASR